MAAKIHGVLGSAALNDTTQTTIYTVPSGRKATVSLNVANADSTAKDITVRVGGAIIEPGTTLAIKGVLERSGITLSAAQTVTVTLGAGISTVAVPVAVWGIEEDA